MSADLTFLLPEGVFSVRAGAVIVHEGKLLAMRDERRSREDRHQQREHTKCDGKGKVPPTFRGVHRPLGVHCHDRAAAVPFDAFFVVLIHGFSQILKRNIVTSPSAMT